MSVEPRVSVLMPAYNAARYLAPAIRSVLTQTLRELELIVVDDGSQDDTATIAETFAAQDPRVRVLRLDHRGIANVNVGVEAARSDLIGRTDADDICLPTRFEKQLAYMDANPDCAAVGTWLRMTDPFGSPTNAQHPPIDHDAIDAALLAGDGSAIVQGTTLFRREALRRSGGWQDKHGWIEDLDLFLRLGEVGRLANLPEELYLYRRHVTSVCAAKQASTYATLERILRDAYARRGLSGNPDVHALRPDLGGPRQSPATMYRNWACHAIHAGNATIARKHAMSALRHEPFKLQSWRVLYWSLAA